MPDLPGTTRPQSEFSAPSVTILPDPPPPAGPPCPSPAAAPPSRSRSTQNHDPQPPIHNRRSGIPASANAFVSSCLRGEKSVSPCLRGEPDRLRNEPTDSPAPNPQPPAAPELADSTPSPAHPPLRNKPISIPPAAAPPHPAHSTDCGRTRHTSRVRGTSRKSYPPFAICSRAPDPMIPHQSRTST